MTDRTTDQPFTLAAACDGAWVLSGEVDAASEAVLLGMLVATSGDGWVIDVTRLDFADVVGMRAIASAARATGRPLALRGAPEPLQRYWRLVGLDELAPGVRFAD